MFILKSDGSWKQFIPPPPSSKQTTPIKIPTSEAGLNA